MLKLTKKADYALMAMKHLAEARDSLARPRRDDAAANRLAEFLESYIERLAAQDNGEAARFEKVVHS